MLKLLDIASVSAVGSLLSVSDHGSRSKAQGIRPPDHGSSDLGPSFRHTTPAHEVTDS